METQATRIAKGSVYLVTQSIITTTVAAIAFGFIARNLKPAEMGVTIALTLTLGVAQLLSDLGFSSGLAKYVAEYRGKNLDYSPIVFTGILTKVFTATSGAILCALAAPWLSILLLKSGDYTHLFQLLSLDLFFFCLSLTISNLFLGFNRIKEMALLNVAGNLARQITAVSLLLYGLGLTGLVVGWTLGDMVYTILSISVMWKGRHIKMSPIKVIIPNLKMFARFSWPLFLTGVVIFLYNWFDRAILLVYASLSEVAVYGVALQAFTVLSLIPSALSMTLFPYYSEQYGRNKHENIVAGVQASTRYVTLLFTPLALGLMITANSTITLFGGPSYASGDTILAILSLSGALSSMGAAFGTLLLVYEMTPTVLLINAASVGVSLVPSPLLLPLFGATGMAIVRGIALIASFSLTTFVLRRQALVKFDKEAIWKSWSASVIMLLVVGLMEYAYFSQYLLLLYVFAGGVTYLIALRLLKAVNQKDINLLQSLIGERGAFISDTLEKVLM